MLYILYQTWYLQVILVCTGEMSQRLIKGRFLNGKRGNFGCKAEMSQRKDVSIDKNGNNKDKITLL